MGGRSCCPWLEYAFRSKSVMGWMMCHPSVESGFKVVNFPNVPKLSKQAS